eukprot:CAMPEP_0206599064 /NCGR_PEP_ID=MMETSP0325_2-20121206/44970_1 /ASSEMBLY_ACC=CAM_ASM_000347 /TAXON_ID=2866 /ORGANISM="Crypthecodinium cohnii, Strain Seligo" /LENGTH=438 /DNA_ID=CAMNT_0054110091 /DNA_START=65 /DNA_END=1382 /DNA_ORIENTATION=+
MSSWRHVVPANPSNPANTDPNYSHSYGLASNSQHTAPHLGSYRPTPVNSTAPANTGSTSQHADRHLGSYRPTSLNSSFPHTSNRDNPQLSHTINTTHPTSNSNTNNSSNSNYDNNGASHPSTKVPNNHSTTNVNPLNANTSRQAATAATSLPADLSSYQQRRLQMIERWLEEERQSILDAEEAEAELVFALDRAHFHAEQNGLPSSCFEDAMSEADPFKAIRGTESGDPTLRAELLGKRQQAVLTLARLRCLQCLTAIATTGLPGLPGDPSSPSQMPTGHPHPTSGISGISGSSGTHFPTSEGALAAGLQGSLRAALQPLLPLLKSTGSGGGNPRMSGGASSSITAAGATASSVAGLERDATSTTASESKFLLGSKTCRSETSSSITETSKAQGAAQDSSREKELQQLRSALAEAYEHIADLQGKVGGDDELSGSVAE